MASNSPFQVEDQTDEDFFDNLVNDDNDDHLGSITPSKHGEGNDSDDARAFENLAIEEESGGATIEALEGSTDDKFIVGGLEEGPVVAPNAVSDGCPSGASNGNSGGLDHSVIGTGKNDNCERLSAELDAGSTNGSPSAGVKEIGWSSFYAGSAENGEHGFGSYSDFFNDLGADSRGKAKNNAETGGFDQNVLNYAENIEATQFYGSFSVDGDSRQDTSSSQHWEMYPGWKFDANTGQWYQLDGYNGSHEAGFDGSAANQGSGTDGKAEVSYLQHTVQSVGGIASTAESSSTQSTVGWNQAYKVNNGYPEHMVFDPQYPGWYYDTIAGAWQTLESYNSSVQSSALSIGNTHEQYQNEFALAGDYTQVNGYAFSEQGQSDNYSAEGLQSQSQNGGWVEDYNNYSSNNFSMWQPTSIGKTEVIPSSVGTLQLDNSFSSTFSTNNHADNHSFNSLHKHQSHDKTSHIEANGHFGPRTFIPSENLNWQLHKADSTQNEQFHFTNDFYNRQKSTSVQNSFHNIQQVPSASAVGRSSAGRPAHALVSFGFSGKLIIMKKEGSFQSSSFSSKDSIGGSISVLNLLEVVTGNTNGSAAGLQTCDYFPALTQQSYPGPLAGGNVSSKELNKWIDERIANCESPDIDYQKGAVVKLLMSLLKIACQHYGKLRSPFGGDTVLKENDTPESAVARLFASAKNNGLHYSAHSQCIQQLPSDGQIRATALEVQNLLVSGRKKEALQCAQGGQLWGPALVLASQLGDQFYVETVKQMALHQLVAGSPLRTLCLLIAGQPAEVFSTETTKNITNLAAQPAQQFGTNCMLDDWEENLAVITANRTKDDELVIIHLGDCLWRERSEITAAHICYLVAESNFESYSDSARLCLIGADHWKFPRTYASPEAIQRTELYEYSKVLGNSQFTLLPFQPYKLVYAHMLAEVGKVSESLKYCQAVLKSLKTGRAPEVETWRQYVSLLEERIRIHQQSGYTANLAPGKLVNKLRNLLDSTANLVVGGPPPPVQSFSPGSTLDGDNNDQQAGPKVSGSQSTMAMSALIPSASMEPISEWAADGNRNTMHIRSVSEPDFGRTPRQDRVDGKEAAISASQGKAHTSRGGSRFARFGFGSQLFQKTVGLVLRPRPDKQAKLGEKNKFYYDEKLKRWVEEGAEPPAEEAVLAPPPTSAFQSGTQHYNLKPASNSWSPSTNGSPKFKNPSPAEHASGIPPIPTSTNQFSARGRMGVRSRYVDTFNQGGGNHVNVFQSPAVKPAAMANAKFFVPTPVATTEESMATLESKQEENVNGETPSTSVPNNTSQSPAPPSTTMPRFPSVDNIERKENIISLSFSAAHSRRAASWSGSVSNSFTPPKLNEVKSPVEASTVPPSSFTPSPVSIGNFGEDLQEVEL